MGLDSVAYTRASDFKITPNKWAQVKVADERSSKAEKLQVKKWNCRVRHRQ
jgi:hypothetical protein